MLRNIIEYYNKLRPVRIPYNNSEPIIIPGKIEFKTAIISILGMPDIGIEHELVSTNEYGTRIIVETDQLHETIRELYHSLFSRQDCK